MCIVCKFPSRFSLQEHCQNDHRLKARKRSHSFADLNKILEHEEDSDQLGDAFDCPSTLLDSQHFLTVNKNARQHFLTVTEMVNGRHKEFSFQLSNLDTSLVKGKLHQIFEKIDCSAIINIALGFVLRNTETGSYC